MLFQASPLSGCSWVHRLKACTARLAAFAFRQQKPRANQPSGCSGLSASASSQCSAACKMDASPKPLTLPKHW